MAATNTTPGTALDLAPLGTVVNIPAADVQGAPSGSLYASTCDATQRHALWFKYTTGTNEIMLAVGIKGAESGDAYHPVMSVWTGTPPSVTQHQVINASAGVINHLCGSFATAVSRSDIWYFSFPVSANTTYYFQVTDANSSTVTTDLNVVGVPAPVGIAKPGDYLIINDAGPFPGAVVDQTTGEILGYFSLGVGEAGTSLQSGQMAFQDTSANAGSGGLQIINRDLSAVATINTLPTAVLNSATLFYLVTFTGNTAHVQLVKPDGSLGSLTDVPNVGAALLVSADSSTFYYTDVATFTLVKRWDLVNNVALTDFAGDFGGAEPTYAFISGQSGYIVIVYVAGSTVMRQWSPDGTLLRTDTLTIPSFNRLVGDLGSDTFQTWNGNTAFNRYGLWDPNTALVNTTATAAQSSNGGPQNHPFAISTSCPQIVIPSASPRAQTPTVGTRQTVPIKWVRRTSQMSDELLWLFFSEFQLMFQPGVGQANDPGANPQIGLRWSNDGGNTWSNQRWVSAGLQGQYGTRAIWRMLGRGRNRVWELTSTDPVVWAIVDAFATVEKQA